MNKCACRVLWMAPLERIPIERNDYYISYCPLHQAAEELLTSIKAVEDWVSAIAQDYVPNEKFHDSGGFTIMETARKAIARAEGKEPK